MRSIRRWVEEWVERLESDGFERREPERKEVVMDGFG